MIQKRTRITALLIAAACLLAVVTVATFAWFQKNYKMGGLNVNTGSIGLTLSTYAYSDGATVQIGSTSDPHDGDAPISGTDHKYETIENGTPAIFFVKLDKQSDSEELAYGLSIYLEGLMQSNKDYNAAIEYTGGFWYQIFEVYPELGATAPDASDETLLANELSALTNIAVNTQTPGNTEELPALSGIDTDVRVGKLNDEQSCRYYQVTIGKYASATTGAYSDRELKMHAVVNASQGDKATLDGKTQVWVVSDKAELFDAITQYMPGDTIKIVGEILVDRDLIFNRPVNLYINDKSRLTVEGNFIMSFNSSENCVVDTTGSGQILITRRRGTNAGGNLQINTPSSMITFNGSNNLMLGRGDLYVERSIIFGAAYNKGVVIKNCNIYTTGVDANGNACINTSVNNYKYLYITNGGYLRVEKGTTVGYVFAASSDVKYLGIVNNGTIAKIDLGDMTQDKSITDMPQIYIRNNGMITDEYIVLPSTWPKKYNVGGGSDNGNTRIIQDISGYPMTVGIKRSEPQYADYEGFADEDIERVRPSDLVVKNDFNGTNLTVYYYNIEADDGSITNTSIKGLLEDFFKSEANAALYPNGVADGLNAVKSLTVITQANKFVTAADYEYIKSFSQMESLDFSNAFTERVEVNVLVGGSYSKPEYVVGTYAAMPKNVFQGMAKLKKVLLPENTEIVRYKFAPDTAVREIRLPSTVFACEIELVYTGNNQTRTNARTAFPTAYYVFCENRADLVKGLGDQGGVNNNDNVNLGTFPVYAVNDAFVSALEQKYSTTSQWYNYSDEWRKRVVPMSEIAYEEYTVSGFTYKAEYLLHSLGNDEWEIVYYRADNGRKPSVIGANIKSEDGQKTYNITRIGDNAFSGVYKTSVGTAATNVSFADSVTEIGTFSFGTYNASNTVGSLELSKVQTVGYGAFAYMNITSGKLDNDSVTRIESYAFFGCNTLTDVSFDACTYVGNCAFNDNMNLVTAYLPNATTVNSKAFNVTSGISNDHNLKLVTLGTPLYWGESVFVDSNLELGKYSRVLVIINGDTPLADPTEYTGVTTEQANITAVVKNSVYDSYGAKPFTTRAVTVSDDCWTADNAVIQIGATAKSLSSVTSDDFEGENAPVFAYCRSTVNTDYDSGDGTLIIPASHTGAVLVHSWAWDIDLHKYSIPASVVTVQNGTKATDTLVAIGDYAFQNTTITNADSTHPFALPDSVKRIGYRAFNDCDFNATTAEDCRTFNMGQGVELIGAYGVCDTNFNHIIFSKKLHTISAYAFAENQELSEISKEDWCGNEEPVRFAQYSFYNNDGLIKAYLADGAVELGFNAFANCDYLQSVSGLNIKAIQAYCFRYCYSLDFVDFPMLSTLGDQGSGSITIAGGHHFDSIDNHLKLVRFGVIENGYSRFSFNSVENGGAILLNGMPVKKPAGNVLFDNISCFTNGIIIGEKGSKAFYSDYVNRDDAFAELYAGLSAADVEFYTASSGREWLYAVNNKSDSVDDGIYIVYCYADKLTEAELKTDLNNITAYVNQQLGLSGTNALSVVSIGERCFRYTSMDGELDLSNTSVKYVGAHAFYGTKITKLILPDNMAEISDYALSSLSELESVAGSGVKTIGAYAFKDDAKLTELSFPMAEAVGDYAFSGCIELDTVNLSSARTIGSFAFQNCYALTELSINEAHSIGNRAFSGCLALGEFSANKVITIGEYAFSGIHSFTRMELPALKEVHNYAFYNCDGLAEFVAENLTTVRALAFADCGSLTRVYIPSAINFYQQAFANCTYIAELTVGSISYIENTSWLANTVGGSLIIEGKGATINAQIFYSYTHFSSGYAFMSSEAYSMYSNRCDNRIIILNDIDTTSYEAYKQLPSYSTVTLNGIQLPKYVYTTNGNTATVHVTNAFKSDATVLATDLYKLLKNENANNAAVNELVIGRDFCYSKGLTGELDFSYWNSGSTELVLKEINANAFRDCTEMKGVTLPDSFTALTGGFAFYNCRSMTSFSAPMLKSITGNEAFRNCSALVDVYLPELTTATAEYLFHSCASIIKIELPKLTSFGRYCMSGCTALTYFDAPMLANLPVGLFENCMNVAVIRVDGSGTVADIDYRFNTGSNVNTIILFTGVTSQNGFVDRLNQSACTTLAIMQNGSTTGGASFVNTLASSFDVSKAKPYGSYSLRGVNVGKYYYVKSNDGTALQLLFCMQKTLTAEEFAADMAAIESSENAKFTDIGKMALRFTTLTGDMLEIPANVQRIGDYAFNNPNARGSVNTVKFENAMKSIGKLAFDGTAKSVIINVTDASTHGNASTHRIDVTADSDGKYKLFASNATLYVGGVGKQYYEGQSWAGLSATNMYGYELEGANGEQFFFEADPNNANGVILKSMLLPSNWTSDSLTIPSTVGTYKVTGIANDAFVNVKQNTTVKKLVLPDYLAANAFAKYDYSIYFSGLEAFVANSTSDNFSTENGVLFSKDGKTLWAYPTARAGESYTVPSRVTRIGITAFVGARNLVDVYYGTNP